jgi:hypothetical protein
MPTVTTPVFGRNAAESNLRPPEVRVNVSASIRAAVPAVLVCGENERGSFLEPIHPPNLWKDPTGIYPEYPGPIVSRRLGPLHREEERL